MPTAITFLSITRLTDPAKSVPWFWQFYIFWFVRLKSGSNWCLYESIKGTWLAEVQLLFLWIRGPSSVSWQELSFVHINYVPWPRALRAELGSKPAWSYESLALFVMQPGEKEASEWGSSTQIPPPHPTCHPSYRILESVQSLHFFFQLYKKNNIFHFTERNTGLCEISQCTNCKYP